MADPTPVDILVRLIDSETKQPIGQMGQSLQAQANQYRQEAAKENAQGQTATSANQTSKLTLEVLKDIKNLNTRSLEGEQKKQAELMKFVSEGAMRIANGLKGILTKSFEVVEMMYKKISAASPLLQAIEQLFNLAWTVFFMPIGNKIGELLIPAVIGLMDKVMAFWDEYGDGGIDEMVKGAVHMGIQALSGFFSDIGDALADQGSWIGAIGRFLQGLGRFIENKGEALLDTVLGLSLWVMSHMGTIITLIGTFMSLHYALQMATMATIAGSNTLLGKLGLGFAFVTGAAGIGVSAAIGSQFNMAEGGYVPATPGGQIHRLAEAGEGEYVIPESKIGRMGNTYNISINSYTPEETNRMVRSIIRDEVSESRLRSGF